MYLERAREIIRGLRDAQRYRTVPAEQPATFADFSSNDYLGLATDSRMLEAIKHVKRVGASGSRLLGGSHRDHSALEMELARFLGRERALLFSSGYLAALGAVTALARVTDCIYSDALNHASLIDGMRLCKVPRHIYEHRELAPAEQRSARALVVTESLFSMDGDVADIAKLLPTIGNDDVLLVDEAHALGVCGPQGAGICATLADARIVVLGTLSKAFGSAGGFVAGPADVIELVANVARSFIFDTAPALPTVLAARVGVMLAQSADDLRARLHNKAKRLRDGLQAIGLHGGGDAAIVPVIFGSEARAMEVSAFCLKRGIIAPAIRPPTVPAGASRLRLCVRATHTDEQIDLLVDALRCAVTS